MKPAALALLICLDPTQAGQQATATQAQAADATTTVIGLALGAAEANPLGLAALGLKVVAHQRIKAAPAADQPALWSGFAALGWGATANN